MSKTIRFLYLIFVVIFSISAVQDFQAGDTFSAVIDCLLVFGNIMILTFVGGAKHE